MYEGFGLCWSLMVNNSIIAGERQEAVEAHSRLLVCTMEWPRAGWGTGWSHRFISGLLGFQCPALTPAFKAKPGLISCLSNRKPVQWISWPMPFRTLSFSHVTPVLPTQGCLLYGQRIIRNGFPKPAWTTFLGQRAVPPLHVSRALGLGLMMLALCAGLSLPYG